MRNWQIASVFLAGAFLIGGATASASSFIHQPKRADLVVKVRDSQGVPVTSTVTLSDQRRRTDPNGRVQFSAIPIGAGTLRIEASGFIAKQVGILVQDSSDPVVSVTLDAQPPVTYPVSISVTDWLSGFPLPGVAATLGSERATSDPSGNIHFDVPSTGGYQLNLSKPGYREDVQTVQITSSNVLLPVVKLISSQRALTIRNGKVMSSAVDGTSQTTVPVALGTPTSLSVSPDGVHAVVLSRTPEDLVYAWAVQTSGTTARQLSAVKAGSAPVWSPNGLKILIIDPLGLGSVFTADGQRIGQLAMSLYEGTFSKDGLHLLSAGINSGDTGPRSTLTLSSIDGSSPKVLASHTEKLFALTLSDNGETAGAFSQNGTATQHFSYNVPSAKEVQTPAGAPDLRPVSHSAQTGLQTRISLDGNPEVLQTNGSLLRSIHAHGTADLLQVPYFSTDGSILFYESIENGLHSFYAVPVATGTTLRIPFN